MFLPQELQHLKLLFHYRNLDLSSDPQVGVWPLSCEQLDSTTYVTVYKVVKTSYIQPATAVKY